ncbi:hypothetical protein FW778_22310 [Ginsengibacter hankyongi]|uniref:Uncharacterized protein n=1 Tax=Ginsengibacter hankyongi TaxID=2607284 RepID=A0A5J5IBA8_9BACT|nr:hypothetical protein [Ginsengibacter hankyongi]KAA9034417.1 hypothetical protein FW778_22310 [Ginsengibacter hankyongi]
MKKALLAISIVTISFAACSSGNDKDKTNEVTTSDTSNIVTKDTMQVIKDSTVKTTVTVDTTKVDTSKKK